jgi:hypothetical protein
MASQAQIEANRRNARKSTGPRSASGKKRASRNAFSHGLSRPMFGAAFTRAVEALTSPILDDLGKANDQHALASARQIADAELELGRVQRIKIALIERAAINTAPPMPQGEPQRTAEAVRRVLPDLVRLNRYEQRAAARRDRAVRRLAQSEGRRTLEASGIEFIDENGGGQGVRLRKPGGRTR